MSEPDLSTYQTETLYRLLRTPLGGRRLRLIYAELDKRDREYAHVERMNRTLARNRRAGTEDGTKKSPRITRFAWRGL